MHEEIDECGIIIQDFTAVSEWEIFILKIEEAINDWKLSQVPKERPLEAKDFNRCPWRVSKEKITFGTEEFLIVRYKLILPDEESTKTNEIEENEKYCQALSDMFISKNDFDQLHSKYRDDIPSIGTWYGLRDFVLLISSNDITHEGMIKMLLSSISIAITDTGCEIPIFVKCHEEWQQYYLGICESKGLCVKFDAIHLRRIPSQCYHLIGLLDLFKGKVASTVPLETVQISARFTYLLTDLPSFDWSQSPPDFDFLQGYSVGISDFSTLPFGAVHETIKSFLLCASWMQLSDDTVVDSQSYTDFDPLLAPLWSMKIDTVNKPICLVSEYYSEFIGLSKCHSQLNEILTDARDFDLTVDDSNFITAKSIMTTTSRICDDSPIIQEREHTGPLSSKIIVALLKYIFQSTKSDDLERPIVEEKSPFTVVADNLKADPYNGLVWRLAVGSAHVSQALGGISALAHLWYEFCQEIRYQWENAIFITGLLEGFPNSRTCLLHQKLQMINICIDRRKRRDEAAILSNLSLEDSESSESEDEFFDCDIKNDDENENSSTSSKKKCRPAGRLDKFGTLKLLGSNEPLYLPMTQEPVPKTEDQLEQDAEVMLNLGTDAQASEMRANIMSASLLSDMESFKAANPDAVFEDFIRWYSPRDWIKDEELDEYGEKKGHLSTRMMIEDNVWLEVWRSAKPVPAKRQKRLFDDTTEAEKTLHFLESRTISQIVDLILPSLTHAVLCKLGEESKNKSELPQLAAAFERMVSTAVNLTRDRAKAKRYKNLSEQIYNAELAIAHLKSLRKKFNVKDGAEPDEDMKKFLTELLEGEEASVPGASRGKIGGLVCRMFKDAMVAKSEEVSFSAPSSRDGNFPEPTEKEFVLRVMARRPASTSTPSPQMMRVIIKKDEFRILGAFTEDVIFT